jgi:2-dehydro-3-deoxyphosphogluconate aldolase/(4S)-4-hydroxy-2-oxoglutarate aldolase
VSNKAEIIARLIDPGVIAIVRANSAAQVLPLTEALLAGGIVAIEITLTTPNAISAISEAVQRFGDAALIGVGTVLDVAACRQAIQAGAQFVVTPILRPAIAVAAHELDRPVMLGAYTPTEAQLAHEAGADFVKIFPADGLGPAYVKALLAPLPHLKIVPTGGVDLTNLGDFFQAGCPAVGVGSSLLSPRLLAQADWPALTLLSKRFSQAARAAKNVQK